MEQAQTGKEDGETAVVRCLKATRWVVVIPVMVLTVAASVRALVVAFRPIDLYVTVSCGSVGLYGPSANMTTAKLELFMCNPSGRDGVRYVNLTLELLGNSTSSSPGQSIVSFPTNEVWVGKQHIADVTIDALGIVLPEQFANLLSFPNASISNGTVKIEGYLQRRITGLKYTHGYPVKYYCWPVTIGRTIRDEANDVNCSLEYQGEPTQPVSMCLRGKKCQA